MNNKLSDILIEAFTFSRGNLVAGYKGMIEVLILIVLGFAVTIFGSIMF